MRIRPSWIVFAAWLWSALACATPATPATIDELLHKSGLWAQLASMGAQFQRSVAQGAAQQGLRDPQVVDRLRGAFAVTFSAERLRPAVARAMATELSAEDAAAALAWLATDLGQRITRLEEVSAGEAAVDNPSAIGAALPPARRDLYLRLSRSLRAGDVAASVVTNVAYGIARGISSAMPNAATRDPEDLRALLQERRPRLVALLEEQLIGINAVTYGALTDAELARYIAFAESPAGSRYHAATAIALDRALTAAAVEAGRLMVRGQST